MMDILRDACRAPSGDNVQPWRFRVHGDTVSIVNVPEKDHSLFNWHQMTSYMAIGAGAFILFISAAGRGLKADVEIFPDAHEPLLAARISLSPGPSAHDGLAPFIAKRASNRKRYLKRVIEPEKLAELQAVTAGSGRVEFVTGKENVKRMARIVSTGERLALENKDVHDFLFSHVTWTEEEDSRRHGFFINTFELVPPQKMAFKLFRNWNTLKLFLPFGVGKFVANEMGKVHATSAAFGAIVVPGRSEKDWVRTGMLMERLWLTATKLGLSLQPATTVHFIGMRVLADDPGGLSTLHQELLRKKYAELAEAFSVNVSETFGFVFRLGYADAPSAMTTRYEPDAMFEEG